MKAIPYVIVGLVTIPLLANILLIVYPDEIKRYFLWVKLITGITLITIILLSIFSKKRLKKTANQIYLSNF
jgi:hypothetical protein